MTMQERDVLAELATDPEFDFPTTMQLVADWERL